MILRILENIRRKPMAVRQRYAFVTTAVFTAVVAGVWSLSLPARFSAVQDGMMTATPAVSSQTASAPFSGVWSEFKAQVLGKFKENTSPTTNPTVPLMNIAPTDTSNTPESTSFKLESGSTIRFGADESVSTAPAILLGTTSTTSSTSANGL